jgi:hypothetical protein
MKVIFLDIDGVLNSERLMNRRLSEGLKYDCDEELYHNIDEIEVERLANFCKEYNVKIVLSSSWRCWNLEETIEEWRRLNVMVVIMSTVAQWQELGLVTLPWTYALILRMNTPKQATLQR